MKTTIKRTRKVWDNGSNAPKNIEHIFHIGKKCIGSIFEPSELRVSHPQDYRLSVPDKYGLRVSSFYPTFAAAYDALTASNDLRQ